MDLYTCIVKLFAMICFTKIVSTIIDCIYYSFNKEEKKQDKIKVNISVDNDKEEE